MQNSFVRNERLKGIFKIFIVSLLAVIAAFIGFIGIVYLGFFGKIPTKSGISELNHGESTTIYDVNGKIIGNFFRHYRSPVTYEQLPGHLVEALIATEDARFYSHNGIDYKSLLRVLIKTILLGDESAGGGSTITQQLAKNLYPREKSGVFHLVVAKVKESLIARRIEAVYSKEEIITLYLNTVPFPENVYGIETASRTFFSKSVEELSLTEAACLIGTLKATYTYNPRLFPERSMERRNVVISQMVKFGKLPEDSAEVAKNQPLQLTFQPYQHHQGMAPYFREQVRKQLHLWVQENPKDDNTLYDIYKDGLKIYTTLDVRMQQLADSAVKMHLASLQQSFEKNWGKRAPWLNNPELLNKVVRRSGPYRSLERSGLSEEAILDSLGHKKPMHLFTWTGEKEVEASTIDSLRYYLKFLQAGFVVTDPSGAVKAWVGGIDHQRFQYDHVSQSRRQVGSTFKPIVYTAALEDGLRPCDHFSGRMVTYTNMEGWTPENHAADYSGKNLSMKEGLSKSVNTIAVRLLEKTGIKDVVKQARKLNISSELPEVPSLALGTAEITMLELAGAYASFINESRPVEPFLIRRITTGTGRVLAEFEPEEHKRAYSESTQEIMLELLQAVVDEGTASRIRWKYGLKNDIAGKTGTTQGNRDGWFAGVTPGLVAVSWVGADHPEIRFKDTALGQGANSALPIFALFMKMLNQQPEFNDITQAKFAEPSDRTMARLDCEPVKEDGFFKRIFTNSDEPEEREFNDKSKVGRWLKNLLKKE